MSKMPAGRGRGLATQTVKGVIWVYGSYVAARGMALVTTAILARLLAPSDFGLVALALVFMVLLHTLSDLGLTQALVVAPEHEVLERADTAFTSSLLLGLALFAVIAALGPAASSFFNQPDLTAIMPVLGLSLLFRAGGTTHYALAQRQMDFRSRTIAEVANALARGSTGIVLALAGFGAWSLVFSYLVGAGTLTLALWALIPWRPSLRLRRHHLAAMLPFGGTVTALDVLSAVIGNVDDLFVGRFLGTTALGFYTLAFRLPDLLIVNFSGVASQVLLPAFATIDRRSIGRAFTLSLRYTSMLVFPLTAVLVTLAQPLVLALFGERWGGSVSAMQVLALYALAATLSFPAGTAYKAIQRVGVLVKLAVPWAVLLVTSVALLVDEGIVIVAACQAAVTGVFALVGIVLAARMLAVAPGEIWDSLWRPAAATGIMAAVIVPLEHALANPWLALGAALVAGAATYFAALWLLAESALRELATVALARRVPPGPTSTLGPDA